MKREREREIVGIKIISFVLLIINKAVIFQNFVEISCAFFHDEIMDLKAVMPSTKFYFNAKR